MLIAAQAIRALLGSPEHGPAAGRPPANGEKPPQS